MKIYSAENRPSKKASSNWFSGPVWQDPIIVASTPAQVHALKVAFKSGGEQPGTRILWGKRSTSCQALDWFNCVVKPRRK